MAGGQAPLVRADFAVPFLLRWEHGLFVSTERLVEVGGTNFEPRWEHGRVRVYLKRLLCLADQGICMLSSDQWAPYQLGVFVQNDDCLFATKAVTPPVPLYVVRNDSSYASNGQPLSISGGRNYYRNTQVVLQQDNSGDAASDGQYTFDELTLPGAPSWYREENPEPVKKSVFTWDPPNRTADRQTLHDFIPPSFGDGWFTQALAVIPSQLPTLPDVASLLEKHYAARSPYAPKWHDSPSRD